MPAINPTGRPINAAMPTISRLPTMALANPPPSSPAGSGSLVKKLQLSEEAPLEIRSPRIRNSTETVSTVTTPVSVSITALRDLRQRSRVFMPAWNPSS